MNVFLQQVMCMCMGMRVAEFLGQGRPILNLGSSYCLGLVLGGVCTGAAVSSMLLACQVGSRVHVWA